MTGDVSFTQRVVAELAPHAPPLACCRRALIEGMMLVSVAPNIVSTTRLAAARAAVLALHRDHVAVHVTRVASARRPRYVLSRVDLPATSAASTGTCCTRSRLRGAFLSAGRMQRPEAGPHLEISCPATGAAERLAADAALLGVPMGIRRRRGSVVVTARTTAAVGAFLTSVGAHTGRLDYEAGRVVRDLRTTVNRRLNAETANLRRTATAGVAQVHAARVLLRDPTRWHALPAALQDAALLRHRHPNDNLAALAARSGCSRSAMAGRLRRLVALAAGDSVQQVQRSPRESVWQ